MKYFVTLAGRTHEVEVDGDRVVIDGVPVQATLERLPGGPVVRLELEGASIALAIEGYADGVWRLVRRGGVSEVGVEDERSRHIRLLAGEGKATQGGGVVKAPMPGLVVRIPVAEGEAVAQGAGLLVLEAMKMENELKAPGPGVVRSVRVAVGEAVEKGQVLLELAPPP